MSGLLHVDAMLDTRTDPLPHAVVTTNEPAAEEPKDVAVTETQTQQTPQHDEQRPSETEAKDDTDGHEGEEGEGDKAHADKPKAKGGVSQRFAELTREKHEARREAEFWKTLAQDSGRVPTEQPQQQQPAAPEATAKPTPQQFTDYSDYVEALADWKAEQRVSAALAKREADAAQARQSAEWQARQDAVRVEMPDYDDVVGSSDIEITPTMVEAITTSDNGPRLTYWLASNPDEAKRIAGLSPVAAARALGRIEASLEVKPAPTPAPASVEPRKVSKAPAPIKPISGSNVVAKSPEDMSFAEYQAWRRSGGGR